MTILNIGITIHEVIFKFLCIYCTKKDNHLYIYSVFVFIVARKPSQVDINISKKDF